MRIIAADDIDGGKLLLAECPGGHREIRAVRLSDAHETGIIGQSIHFIGKAIAGHHAEIARSGKFFQPIGAGIHGMGDHLRLHLATAHRACMQPAWSDDHPGPRILRRAAQAFHQGTIAKTTPARSSSAACSRILSGSLADVAVEIQARTRPPHTTAVRSSAV